MIELYIGQRIRDGHGDDGTIVKLTPGQFWIKYDHPDLAGEDFVYDRGKYAHKRLVDISPEEPPQEVRVTDPLTGGQKGSKPEKYSMIPARPLAEVARVYGLGAEKYARENWRKGYAWSLSFDALLRHIETFRAGTSLDGESGQHHLAHAVFHCMTLMEYDQQGLGTDDRGDVRRTDGDPDSKVIGLSDLMYPYPADLKDPDVLLAFAKRVYPQAFEEEDE